MKTLVIVAVTGAVLSAAAYAAINRLNPDPCEQLFAKAQGCPRIAAQLTQGEVKASIAYCQMIALAGPFAAEHKAKLQEVVDRASCDQLEAWTSTSAGTSACSLAGNCSKDDNDNDGG
jgi:hypothetical protein